MKCATEVHNWSDTNNAGSVFTTWIKSAYLKASYLNNPLKKAVIYFPLVWQVSKFS